MPVTPRRNAALSIAGLDPTGGAGLLADIKTFEEIGVPAGGAATGVTFQSSTCFYGTEWLSHESISSQINPLFQDFHFRAVKIGIVRDLEMLAFLTDLIKTENPQAFIIWDPVVSSTTGHTFHESFDKELLLRIITSVDLMTPNLEEIRSLVPEMSPYSAAIQLAEFCPVLLKGGHAENDTVTDTLYHQDTVKTFQSARLKNSKHGTGCVLSSAIAAYMVQGYNMEEAVFFAREYVLSFIESDEGLLGKHKGNTAKWRVMV